MNVEDAAHAIAHDFPGGLKVLADRMGIGRTVFNGKVNPTDRGHVLGLVESVRMQQLSGRYDILYAMADDLDHVCIRRPDASGHEDVSRLLADVCGEFGDYMRKIDETLFDKKVSQNEVKALQRELLELIAAATHLNAKLESMAKA